MSKFLSFLSKYKKIMLFVLVIIIIGIVIKLIFFIDVAIIRSKGVDHVAKTFVTALNEGNSYRLKSLLCNNSLESHLGALLRYDRYKKTSKPFTYKLQKKQYYPESIYNSDYYYFYITSENKFDSLMDTNFVIIGNTKNAPWPFATPCISFQVP